MILRRKLATLLIGMVTVCGSSASAQEEERERVVELRSKAIMVSEDGKVIEIEGVGDGKHLQWFVGGDNVLIDSDVHLLGEPGGFLGVEMTELTDPLRVHFGVPEGTGVMIGEVVDGSPAQIAGLSVGDIVTAIDGETVSTSRQLSRQLRRRSADDNVDLEVWRDGKLMQLSAVLVEREREVLRLDRDGNTFRLEGPGELHDILPIRLDDAVGQLKEFFEGGEMEGKVRLLRSLDLENIEERMEEVQRQLRELEERLAAGEKPPR